MHVGYLVRIHKTASIGCFPVFYRGYISVSEMPSKDLWLRQNVFPALLGQGSASLTAISEQHTIFSLVFILIDMLFGYSPTIQPDIWNRINGMCLPRS